MSDLTLNQYQENAAKTAVYPPDDGPEYCTLGVVNEAGEFAGVRKKFLRGDFGVTEYEQRSKKELGDILWYVAMAARELGFTLEEIAIGNTEKLSARAEAGTLKGDGDNR